jgi:hypothetical protein
MNKVFCVKIDSITIFAAAATAAGSSPCSAHCISDVEHHHLLHVLLLQLRMGATQDSCMASSVQDV